MTQNTLHALLSITLLLLLSILLSILLSGCAPTAPEDDGTETVTRCRMDYGADGKPIGHVCRDTVISR